MPWYFPVSDWFTGYDAENARRAAEADAKLRELNQAKIDSGYYSPAQADAIRRDYETQDPFGETAQRNAIGDAFDQGWQEGKDSFKDSVNSTIFGGLKELFTTIPASVWFIGFAVAFFYFGGWDWIRKKL